MSATTRRLHRALLATLFAVTAATASGVLVADASAAKDLPAEEISRRASQSDKVESWRAESRLEIRSPNGSPRVREGSMVNLLRDNGVDAMRLYQFDRPADIQGTSLLIHEENAGDDNLWLYLPSAGKSRRIVAGNMKNSFVGTEFAFVDLMTQQVSDFNHVETGREKIDGVDCHVIESRPRDATIADDIGYSMQRAWVRSDNFVTVRIDYFDIKDQPLKSQRMSNLKQVDPKHGKWIAGRREMVNLQSGRSTVISFDDIVVNTGVDSAQFAPAKLGRR